MQVQIVMTHPHPIEAEIPKPSDFLLLAGAALHVWVGSICSDDYSDASVLATVCSLDADGGSGWCQR